MIIWVINITFLNILSILFLDAIIKFFPDHKEVFKYEYLLIIYIIETYKQYSCLYIYDR